MWYLLVWDEARNPNPLWTVRNLQFGMKSAERNQRKKIGSWQIPNHVLNARVILGKNTDVFIWVVSSASTNSFGSVLLTGMSMELTPAVIIDATNLRQVTSEITKQMLLAPRENLTNFSIITCDTMLTHKAWKFTTKQQGDTEARMIILQDSTSDSSTWTDVDFSKLLWSN